MTKDILRLARSMKPIKISLARGGRPKKSAVNKQTAAFNAKAMSDEEYSKLLRSMGLRSARDPEISPLNMFFGNNDELIDGLKNRNQQYGLRQQQTDLFPDLPDDDAPNKSNGGELKDPTKRAAFASLFMPRETNLPATVISPAPAPATPEENTVLANRSPSNGPASAENPDLIAKATQTLMGTPVTRRKFLETSRNAVAAANQAPTISRLLKQTETQPAVGRLEKARGVLDGILREPVNSEHPILKGIVDEKTLAPSLIKQTSVFGIGENPMYAYEIVNGGGTRMRTFGRSAADRQRENAIYERAHEHIKKDLEERTNLKFSQDEFENLLDEKTQALEEEAREAERAEEERYETDLRANGGLIHKESGGRISREQQLFINYLKKHYPDGIILHHETPGHEGQSIRKNKLQGGYGVFAAIDAPSNFVTSKNKTTTKFRVPASHYEHISPDMGYGGDDDESTHNDPFIDFMNKHPNPKGAYVGTSYEEIPDHLVKEIKEDHDDGPKYFSDGGPIHKEDGGSLAARRAEAQAYIKDLIEQRKLYAKGSSDYDFYTKQIAEQGKIVAQREETPPQKVVTPGAGHNNPPEKLPMRRTNALGVYSHAAEVARNAKQEAMPPEDWVKFLQNQQGVKEDELTWAKVADMTPSLGKKTVSKNEVAQRLDNANLDDYEEVVRDNRYLRDPNTNEKIDPDSARHLIASEAVENPALLEKIFGDSTDDVKAELSDLRDDLGSQRRPSDVDQHLADYLYNKYRVGPLKTYLKATQANHEGYTIRGSGNNKNYREIIAQWKPEKKLFQYDSHYSDYNPLFHLRLADVFKPTPPMSDDEVKNLYFKSFGIVPIDNDEWSTKNIGPGMLHHVKNKIPQEDFDRLHSWWRQNYPNDNQFGPAPGKKYLHAEEVQADWAQKGRGKFEDVKAMEKAKAAYQAAVKAAEDATNRYVQWQKTARKNLEIAHGVNDEIARTDYEEYKRRDFKADRAWYEWRDNNFENSMGEKLLNLHRQADRDQNRRQHEYYQLVNHSVPAGPHVTDTKKWTDLAAKRLLKEMADGNYAGIVLSNGNIQSNRWSGQPGVKEYYDEKLEPTLDRMMKMHDPKAGKTSENFEIPIKGAMQRSMQTHAEVADAMGVDVPQNDTERVALVQAWADLPSATRNQMENNWRARNQSSMNAHQLPIFESTPQANASIPNNQKSWKRGGRIGYDEGGDIRNNYNPGHAADANRPSAAESGYQNQGRGSGVVDRYDSKGAGNTGGGDNRPDNRPDNSNDRFNIGGGNAPMPPQRGDDSFFGNMGGNIGSVLGGLAFGPLGSIGGRYLGNQFNQPDNSRFEAKNDEFGNPIGNNSGFLDFLGNSGNPPAPITSDNRRDPIKRKRRILMPDGTYQEVEEGMKLGGVAKSYNPVHKSKIVEHALSKVGVSLHVHRPPS